MVIFLTEFDFSFGWNVNSHVRISFAVVLGTVDFDFALQSAESQRSHRECVLFNRKVAQMRSQIVHQSSEEHSFQILGQQIENKVVSERQFRYDHVGRVFVRRRTKVEDKSAYGSRSEHDRSVEYRQSADDGHEYEPEPNEDVDFLIGDVEWNETEGIAFLYTSGESVLLPAAFDYARKCLDHWIVALFLLHQRERQHFGAVLEEIATEELVDEVDVSHHVDEVKQLADDVDVHQTAVLADEIDKVVVQQRPALLALGVVCSEQLRPAESFRHVLDPAALVRLPDAVRKVEQNSLQEEHEWYPLVVAVVALLRVGCVRPDAQRRTKRILLTSTSVSAERVGEEGVRTGDPTVRVQQIHALEIGGDTVDGFSEQVERSDHDARTEEEGARKTIVQTEDDIVDDGAVVQRLCLDETAHRAQ